VPGTTFRGSPYYSAEAEKLTCNVLEKFIGIEGSQARCLNVPPGETYGLGASPPVVPGGGAVTVTWTAPGGRPATDWIGLYRVGARDTAYLVRRYTGGLRAGSLVFTVPSGPGAYEVRYFAADSFREAGYRARITVP